jgi:hypothetical protein
MTDAYAFFAAHERLEYLWSPTSPELGYLHEVFRLLLRNPAAARFRYYIRNREPIDHIGDDAIVIQVGNEDHALPEITRRAFMLFTPYPPDGELPPNVRAIPLGYNGDVPEAEWKPFAERAVAVFFSGQLSEAREEFAREALRAAAMPALAGRTMAINFTERFRTGIDPADYARHLMDARIALAPPGSQSPVTFRFFEAVRSGAAVISCPLPATWYYDEFPGIRLDDWSALPDVLAGLLENKERLERMHRQTVEYYHRCCSPHAVARYMAEAITQAAG